MPKAKAIFTDKATLRVIGRLGGGGGSNLGAPKLKPKTTNSWPPYATDFGLVSMCKSGTFFSACKPKLVSHRACRKNVLDLHVEKTSWICTREKSLDFQIAPHKEASMKTTRYAPGMHDMGLG